MTRNKKRRGAAGFTLVELLITVALVGVLATLAIVGYRKYMHSAQGSEAKATIQMIRGAQEAYKAEMLQYLNVSTNLGNWYPKVGNDRRAAWVNPGHDDYSRWQMLAVNPDGPVRFGYVCVAGVIGTTAMPQFAGFTNPPGVPSTLTAGTPWYVVEAENDHDGNGKYAMYGSTSLSGEIFSENEIE
ncbi:Type IV pilin PilA [Minicystis rosea]|nr:Type IV pilin PilA [Minicystis rosea]